MRNSAIGVALHSVGSETMTRPRTLVLIALAIVAPGIAQVVARRRRAAMMLGLPTIALMALAGSWLRRSGAIRTALDPALLRRLGLVGVALALLSVASVVHISTVVNAVAAAADDAADDAAGPIAERAPRSTPTILLAALPLVVGAAGLVYVRAYATTLERVFQGGATRALPTARDPEGNTGKLSGFAAVAAKHGAASDPEGDSANAAANANADGNNDTVDQGVAPSTAGLTGTANALAGVGRWNLLLLGGDAGKGRFSLRTDSMILVSIDRTSGDVAMVSVPRNLARLPMPDGPLRAAYPRGWTDLANALYPFVLSHPALGDRTAQAPEHAVKAALAEALAVPIDNYVLVDMGGFIDVIDALGGVTIDIATAVPAPGNPSEAKHPVRAWFGPGNVHLDGTDALAYSRSRENDSDYKRMARQRCLLATAARQISPADLVRNYDKLLSAMKRSVRSDLSPKQARAVVDVFAKIHTDAIRSLGLVPPLVNTAAPDYGVIRRLVAQTLSPPSPVATAAARPAASQPTTLAVSNDTPVSPAIVLDPHSSC